MRFCFVTTFFPPEHFGGEAIFVAQLANLLARAGHEVHVVHCADSFRMLHNAVAPSRVWHDPAVRVHRFESPLGGLSPLATYMTGRPLLKPELKRILAQPFDVVHWHNFSLVAGPGAMSLVDRQTIQLCTTHDYWVVCPTSIRFRFDSEVCTEKTCWRCSISHGRPPQFWRETGLMENAMERIDCIVAPSEYCKRVLIEGGITRDIAVIHHFYEPKPIDVGARQGNYYFFAGRLEKHKGLQTVLPLFTGGRRLLIAGAGNYETELRRQAAAYPGVEFLGRIPHDQLPALYRHAKATLVPSICEETFGLTVLESLQQGTPVVASHFGALPEIVALAAGGWVYRDPEECRRILAQIDAHPAEARRKGAQSRLDEFDQGLYLQRYLNLVESVRSGKRQAGGGRAHAMASAQ